TDCHATGAPLTVLGEGVATRVASDYYTAELDYTPPSDTLDHVVTVEQRYGVSDFVLVSGDDGVHPIDAFTRLTVAPTGPLNANPELDGFTLQGRGVP